MTMSLRWKELSGSLPPLKNQRLQDICELLASISLLEVKVRRQRFDLVGKNRVILSVQFVIDGLERNRSEYANWEFNEAVRHFLRTTGVVYERDYGPNDPDFRRDPRRFERFMEIGRQNRVEYEVVKMMPREDLLTYFQDGDSIGLAEAVLTEPVLVSIKVRKQLFDPHLTGVPSFRSPFCKEKDGSISIHTSLCVGFELCAHGLRHGPEHFQIKNTWGAMWKEDGFGPVHFKDIQAAWTFDHCEGFLSYE